MYSTMIVQTHKAYAAKFYNNRRYVGAAVLCAFLCGMVAFTHHQTRRRLPAGEKYEHKLVGNLMSCQEDGLTRTNKALLGDVAPNGEYASYFEPQEGTWCALHSVTCVMASMDQPDIPTRKDMNKASKSIGMKELMPFPICLDEATASGIFGHNGNWDGKVIKKVLEDRKFVVSDNTEPGADAWIANKGGHWYAYTRTPQGQWFNVDSLWQSPKDGKTHPKYMNGPQWIGDEAAVIKEIESHRKKYGSRYTLYRVSLPAHGAAPTKSMGKDESDGEAKSDTSGTYSDMKLDDTPAPTVFIPPAVETKPPTKEKTNEPWACTTCTLLNEPDRTHCKVCGAVRSKSVGLCIPSEQPPAPKATTEYQSLSQGLTGQWVCSACTMGNTSDRIQCKTCGTPKPKEGEPQPAAHWTCQVGLPWCSSHVNPPSSKSCQNCTLPRGTTSTN